MKVIFLTDVKKQAKKDEIKDVKDGYATYLINNHLAVAYSAGSVNVLNKQVKQRQDEEDCLACCQVLCICLYCFALLAGGR